MNCDSCNSNSAASQLYGRCCGESALSEAAEARGLCNACSSSGVEAVFTGCGCHDRRECREGQENHDRCRSHEGRKGHGSNCCDD